ncbi:MAG: response regulator transcription factor [Cellulosilyticaceae bacterium]
MYRILVVEDEKRLQEVMIDYLRSKGYEVSFADNGIEALEEIREAMVDLILLDIMMPRLDGFSVCREIRKVSEVPIIFLTAKGDEDDQVYGYEIGADDYVTKPFSLAVLGAKVASNIKRAKGIIIEEKLLVGDIMIDCKEHKVYVKGQEVGLAPKEYEMLLYLVQNKNQIITREQLIVRLWGYDFEGNDRVIDTHMKKLRKALGECSIYIHTVIKVGYRFEVRG